jgi:hypothetical protein
MKSERGAISVVGSWWVVKTEYPEPAIPGIEFYHFTEDGWNIWDTPLSTTGLRFVRFRYFLTERGISMGGRYEIELQRDGEDVIFKKENGMRSWFRRLSPDERPLIMTDLSTVDWAYVPSYYNDREKI